MIIFVSGMSTGVVSRRFILIVIIIENITIIIENITVISGIRELPGWASQRDQVFIFLWLFRGGSVTKTVP